MESGYQYEQGRPIRGLELGIVCKLKLWGIIGRGYLHQLVDNMEITKLELDPIKLTIEEADSRYGFC